MKKKFILWLGKKFFGMTPKTQFIRGKMDTWTSSKFKAFSLG